MGRYPNGFPDECPGDQNNTSGVISLGLRPADEHYDVYCYIDQIKGTAFKKHFRGNRIVIALLSGDL